MRRYGWWAALILGVGSGVGGGKKMSRVGQPVIVFLAHYRYFQIESVPKKIPQVPLKVISFTNLVTIIVIIKN